MTLLYSAAVDTAPLLQSGVRAVWCRVWFGTSVAAVAFVVDILGGFFFFFTKQVGRFLSMSMTMSGASFKSCTVRQLDFLPPLNRSTLEPTLNGPCREVVGFGSKNIAMGNRL